VQRPNGRRRKGSPFVAWIASPFTLIHRPIAASRSTLAGGTSPSAVGPTFSR